MSLLKDQNSIAKKIQVGNLRGAGLTTVFKHESLLTDQLRMNLTEVIAIKCVPDIVMSMKDIPIETKKKMLQTYLEELERIWYIKNVGFASRTFSFFSGVKDDSIFMESLTSILYALKHGTPEAAVRLSETFKAAEKNGSIAYEISTLVKDTATFRSGLLTDVCGILYEWRGSSALNGVIAFMNTNITSHHLKDEQIRHHIKEKIPHL